MKEPLPKNVQELFEFFTASSKIKVRVTFIDIYAYIEAEDKKGNQLAWTMNGKLLQTIEFAEIFLASLYRYFN